MEGFLFLAAVFCILSGPIALIIGFTAIKRLKELQCRVDELARASHEPAATPWAAPPQEPQAAPASEEVNHETIAAAPLVPTEQVTEPAPRTVQVEAFSQKEREVAVTREPVLPAQAASLEQRIGTRWVLIAGVITVMFAVAFFLKYAYDQRWIGPLGRVLIAGGAGLAALALGELTRRHGYDIVAKGVTALGFAILYATVFAAQRWYHLIGLPVGFALALGVTAGAMLYAVVLDEIVIALLSLIGGYLTPVVLATGENLPTALFSYVLILGAGAVACAYWRRWSPVNILVLVGTYLLYTGWFERFYRPALKSAAPPEQLGVALCWLTVFFFVCLMLPLLHTLVRRVESEPQDLLLVLSNAGIVFYYLWTLLSHNHRAALAGSSVGLGVAHLILATAVLWRCREDSDLWQVLLLAGLAFVTIAVPLYFEVYAVALLWAIEGLLLVAVGLRYRSLPTQLAGLIVLALAIGDLAADLPLHHGPFRPIFNPAFGLWCLVSVAVIVCHVLYRLDRHLAPDLRSMGAQALYVVGLGLLLVTIGMELWYHGRLNLPPQKDNVFFWEQIVPVEAVFILFLVARPFCPRGQASRIAGTLLAGAAALFVLLTLPDLHGPRFTIFANGDFVRALLLVAVLFASAWLLRRTELREPDEFVAAEFVALGTILVLWILLTEEIWLYYDRLRPSAQWRFLAQMYISITWAAYATALMVIGFWRRLRPVRYLALGIFVLLLAKIFLVDTRELETAYRIAGFLVTGLALVGVSYLYQYLKKTGFFDTKLMEKNTRR